MRKIQTLMKLRANKFMRVQIMQYSSISLLSAFCLFLCLSLSSCSNDETETEAVSPSYRDGVYSGEQLTVTLDGKDLTTVSSVTITSKMLNANVSPDKDSSQVAYPSNPTYTTTVELDGFPASGKTSSFTTVSTLVGFSGTASIQGVEYKYDATFTGDPLARHDKQGLVLSFTKP